MIYIQSNTTRTLPHHFDAASALYGTLDSAEEYRLTTFDEVFIGKFDNLIKSNLFVGSTEFMVEVFKHVKRFPKIINSDRAHVVLSLSDVREMVDKGHQIFVKPLKLKIFSGLVVDKYSISSLREFPNEMEVMVYDVLPKILSEWRMYIHQHKIVDAKNYGGDFKISPNYTYVTERVEFFKKTLPSAYVMDVGITSDNKNVIIEFNDFYAIGNYGIDNVLYLRMLRERYFEIIRNNSYEN